MFLQNQKNSLLNTVKGLGLRWSEFKIVEPTKNSIRVVHEASDFYFLVEAKEVVFSGANTGKEMRLYTYSTPKAGKLILATKEQTIHGPIDDWRAVLHIFEQWLQLLKTQILFEEEEPAEESNQSNPLANTSELETVDFQSLAHLHPVVHKVAGPLFANGHYRQAILDVCIALDKAVQVRAGLPTTTGTTLMTTAFSPKNPLLLLSHDPNEQMGFMNLFQGSVQALRNHYAHNLTELEEVNRALEWLSFLSALFYQLEGLGPPTVPPTR